MRCIQDYPVAPTLILNTAHVSFNIQRMRGVVYPDIYVTGPRLKLK